MRRLATLPKGAKEGGLSDKEASPLRGAALPKGDERRRERAERPRGATTANVTKKMPGQRGPFTARAHLCPPEGAKAALWAYIARPPSPIYYVCPKGAKSFQTSFSESPFGSFLRSPFGPFGPLRLPRCFLSVPKGDGPKPTTRGPFGHILRPQRGDDARRPFGLCKTLELRKT